MMIIFFIQLNNEYLFSNIQSICKSQKKELKTYQDFILVVVMDHISIIKGIINF